MHPDTRIAIIAGTILTLCLVPMVLYCHLTPEPTKIERAAVKPPTVKPTAVKPHMEIVDNYGNVIGKIREVKP